MATVTMRYWAAAKEAAGVAEQRLTADTLAAALAQAAETAQAARTAGAERLRAVLARSSFLIDGDPVGLRAADSVVLRDGDVIEVLPPFAGG
ncbi:MAG TPA: MoaD/ThiS family protein [Streptosporangiaceae bacterium]|jgi:molybdopterin synthase sulfur carrier subunit|nr:MoaD/ThiS family protein [Streptosporangiaceae bacterium]